MIIGGLQKTTLIDYPGKVACTIFLVGCDFRCPFCHNKDLVTTTLFKKSKIKPIKQKQLFAFLEKRKKILDGVCLTGGEPTIFPELPNLIKRIKKLGYSVKLDSNGSRPEVLKKLIKENLVDYIAMDVKGDLDDYQNFIGIRTSKEKIKKSIKLILKSGLPYEFRTTVVPRLHDKKSLVKLAKQLKDLFIVATYPPAKAAWYLQNFQPQNCLDSSFLKIKPYSDKQLKEILKAVKGTLPNTRLRGD